MEVHCIGEMASYEITVLDSLVFTNRYSIALTHRGLGQDILCLPEADQDLYIRSMNGATALAASRRFVITP